MMQEAANNWVLEETKAANIGDERLNRRLGNLLDNLSNMPNKSIPSACKGWTETIAAYRFFDNDLVTPEKILEPHKEATLRRIHEQKIVLLVQDTSEIDYSHRDEIEGMGPLSYDCQQGFYLHPTVAFTPERICLGVINSQMWSRKELGKKVERKNKPIEQKESYRWIESYEIANKISQQSPKTLIVNVADREGDIYELFMETQTKTKHQAHWLIRSTQNRRLVKNETEKEVLNKKLWEMAQKAPIYGENEFHMPKTQERKARKVTQQVRVTKASLYPPARKGKKLLPVEVNVVLCIEKRPMKGEKPLKWLLLTSVEINSKERAFDIIQWYLCRWQIEIYFKILKSGCQIEELQFETFERTINCLALYMIIAWRILYVTMLGRSCPDISCDTVFEESEWKSVYAVSEKKTPPKKPPKLSLMVRMIASLGGFLNRKGDGEPGPQVMWIGIQRMRDFTLAWDIFPNLEGQTCV